MTSTSLVDRYAPIPHDGMITAAAADAGTGARITADATGLVAIVRPAETDASWVFSMAGPVRGAVAICPGGTLAAVGDDLGAVAVHRTVDGECVFEDLKEAESGRTRAMRALAFHPQAKALAALSIDGRIRIWDLSTWRRIAAMAGFGGSVLEWSPNGDRLLACDHRGQPRLIDVDRSEVHDLELVPGGVLAGRFVDGGAVVILLGPTGLVRMSTHDGRTLRSQGARGSSGLLGLQISPDGSRAAAITRRSVHSFRTADLQPVDSKGHGTEAATGVGWWDISGLHVADSHGAVHRLGAHGSLGPVLAVAGNASWRVAAHGTSVALWHEDRQRLSFDVPSAPVKMAVDREGRLVVVVPKDGPIVVADGRGNKVLFTGPPDTARPLDVFVGGSYAGVRRRDGGLRWWDLTSNKELELSWPEAAALSGSGTWLAVVTPRGSVRVLDPRTGEEAIPAPTSPRTARIVVVGFVARRPELLAVDQDGHLLRWDLSVSARESRVAQAVDLMKLDAVPLRIVGTARGDCAVLQYPDDIVVVDLARKTATGLGVRLEDTGAVDAETGHLLLPARGSAILELDTHGVEHAVLRALPFGAFIAFDANGIRQRGG